MKYHIERSTHISADMATVRSLVDDFSQWNGWSPWTVVDPECDVTVEGNPGEVGHKMSWRGDVIGSGEQTISAREDNELHYDLVFLAPFKSKAKTVFRFAQQGDGVDVTWVMDSSMPFFLFFMLNMMKMMIRMDYDRGLRMLKAIAEGKGVTAQTTNAGIQAVEGFSYVGLQRTVHIDEMSNVMPKDMERLMKDVVETNGKHPARWLALYPKVNAKDLTMTYIAAVSDEQLEGVDLGPDYVRGSVASGKALKIAHHGSYDFLGNAWSMGTMFLQSKNKKPSAPPFEIYENSPMDTAPEDLRTSVFFPLKD